MRTIDRVPFMEGPILNRAGRRGARMPMPGIPFVPFNPYEPNPYEPFAPLLIEMGGQPEPIRITQLPGVVDLVLYQGDDFAMNLHVFDAGTETPTVLGGAVVRAQIRQSWESEDAWEFQQAVGMGNVVTLQLHHDTSMQIPLQSVWDCRLTLPVMVGVRQTPWVVTLAHGSIDLTPRITR